MNTYEQMWNNLKYLIDACEDFHQNLETEIDGHYDILPNYIGAAENFLRRINEVKAALSLPRRNCDVGTVDEQIKRFYDEYYAEHSKCKRRWSFGECAIHWSQTPYEKQLISRPAGAG